MSWGDPHLNGFLYDGTTFRGTIGAGQTATALLKDSEGSALGLRMFCWKDFGTRWAKFSPVADPNQSTASIASDWNQLAITDPPVNGAVQGADGYTYTSPTSRSQGYYFFYFDSQPPSADYAFEFNVPGSPGFVHQTCIPQKKVVAGWRYTTEGLLEKVPDGLLSGGGLGNFYVGYSEPALVELPNGLGWLLIASRQRSWATDDPETNFTPSNSFCDIVAWWDPFATNPGFDSDRVRGPIFLVSGLQAVPGQKRRVWIGTAGAAVVRDPDLDEDCLYVYYDVETVESIAGAWAEDIAGDKWIALGEGNTALRRIRMKELDKVLLSFLFRSTPPDEASWEEELPSGLFDSDSSFKPLSGPAPVDLLSIPVQGTSMGFVRFWLAVAGMPYVVTSFRDRLNFNMSTWVPPSGNGLVTTEEIEAYEAETSSTITPGVRFKLVDPAPIYGSRLSSSEPNPFTSSSASTERLSLLINARADTAGYPSINGDNGHGVWIAAAIERATATRFGLADEKAEALAENAIALSPRFGIDFLISPMLNPQWSSKSFVARSKVLPTAISATGLLPAELPIFPDPTDMDPYVTGGQVEWADPDPARLADGRLRVFMSGANLYLNADATNQAASDSYVDGTAADAFSTWKTAWAGDYDLTFDYSVIIGKL